jgi:hypothetical protein
MWLMVVVAIGAGWWVDARAKNEKIRLLELYEYSSKLGRSYPNHHLCLGSKCRAGQCPVRNNSPTITRRKLINAVQNSCRSTYSDIT